MELTTEQIIQIAQAVIELNKIPAPPIPSPLILTGVPRRKGLSARDMAKEVIIRQQEAGAPIGALPDGSDSITEKMERIRMEVLVKHLLENGRIKVVLPAGIPVTITGICPAGNVVGSGVTTALAVGYAVIQ